VARYLLRRLLLSLLLVVVVSSSALVLTRLAPGDITSEQVGSGASSRDLDLERERLGLRRPFAVQYLEWAGRAVRLDLGTSLMYGRPVSELVIERARNTALLAVVALGLATLVGLPLGVIAGSRQGMTAALIRGGSLLALSLPSLVSSLMLVFLAARTGWFPTGGMTSPEPAAGGWLAGALDVARHLVVPGLAIALPLAATLERMQARAVSEILREPFVAAAAARGVPAARVLWRSVLKPALRPVAAIYGLVFGSLLSGSFVVEIVTSWPGLGKLMYDALRSRDLYLVAGCAAAGGVFLAVGALLSDVALAMVDPRLRGRIGGDA